MGEQLLPLLLLGISWSEVDSYLSLTSELCLFQAVIDHLRAPSQGTF